ncbi:MAG: ATP-dependent DNA helicase [Methylophilaceae bacterium]|nr:ATP-dependent DNA helicase [Methylophilaceae bacterium]
MSDLAYIFSVDGPLADAIDGYKLRPQQLEMAQRIEHAITHNRVLVAEAGTGTGKTFAYLVPALLSGGKVILSTGTKTLQDQLFNRDLPAIRNALKVPVTVAMLKGRANYVCHFQLERAVHEGRFMSREDARYVHLIRHFAQTSSTGDKSELGEIPETATIWPMVTSTRDNCIGQECAHYKTCFVMEARKKALAADVVVVNHHLFFADVVLRDEGVSELLPSAHTVIFDEAHQLPEIAGLFFGEDVSTTRLMELARDTRTEYFINAKDCPTLDEAATALEKAVRDFRLVFGLDGARMSGQKAQEQPNFSQAYVGLLDKLSALSSILQTQAERSPTLTNCWQRACALHAQLENWQSGSDDNLVRWVEVFSQSVQLHATPLSVAEVFGKLMENHPRAWIFTSATLAVKNDFSHYLGQMGLLQAETARWDSPFDFGRQALLYVPQDMPEPNTPDYATAVARAALPAIKASGGRAFVLCTTLKAMRDIHAWLKETFERERLDYPLLLQGESARSELLERFRRLGNAVLVASQSFWEGVDVRGEALSLVVIDKLPFAPPDDPVLAARIDKLNAEGRNAFLEYQLPYAVITLKQGAGRLIRDETDRGVLMICDKRLVEKPYGRMIWQSLPPMQRTRKIEDVEAFFASEVTPPSGALRETRAGK